MRRIPTTALIVCLAFIAASRPVRAWGGTGHRIIARIALQLMTPEARRDAIALIGSADDFVALSTWADSVRRDHPETANWHFVSIPFGATTYDAARDCKATEQGDCVLAELDRTRAIIADPSRTAADRQEALKYLIHFLGDFHQPLHNIGNNDRGGNDVRIDAVADVDLAGRQANLHSLWDSLLIEHRGMDEAHYTAFLLKDLSEHPLPDERIDFVAWSLSAHHLAEKFAYQYAGFAQGNPPSAPVGISADYERQAQPVIDRQLELAGARLAAVLNDAFRRAASAKD